MSFRQYRWQALEAPGFELLELAETPKGISVRAMVIGAFGGATYQMTLGSDWSFVSLDLTRLDGGRLGLRADGRGSWRSEHGTALPRLEGCIDIDLSASPFTNSLPIRRADLVIGEARRFRMALVDFETLAVTPHEQIYTRIDTNHIAYQSATSGFSATLETDDDGIVTAYPGLFQRMET